MSPRASSSWPATSTPTTTTTWHSSSQATSPGTGSIDLCVSSKTSFEPLVETYAGVFEPRASRAFAGDVTGDSRADIVLQTSGGDGLGLRVLVTTETGYLLADPVTWYTART